MKRFGFFKGLPYSDCYENFSGYEKFENTSLERENH